MQSYSYYSRTLLLEFLQRTIFFKLGKSLNQNYYGYFLLVNKNKLLISYNSYNGLLEGFIKYENRNKTDFLLYSAKIANNSNIESFVNIVDKSLEDKNLKKGFKKINDFSKIDFSFEL